MKNERIGGMRFLPFEEAKEFVQLLPIQNSREWRKLCEGHFKIKLPPDIPKSPQVVYKGRGWTNWYDWLGKDK